MSGMTSSESESIDMESTKRPSTSMQVCTSLLAAPSPLRLRMARICVWARLRPKYWPNIIPNSTPAASASGNRILCLEFFIFPANIGGCARYHFKKLNELLFLNVYVRPNVSIEYICTDLFCDLS